MRASYIRQGQNAVGSSVQGKSFKEGVGLSLGKDHSTGNGNPLPCSCLENPRDGGAWWAAIYGVAQSWTHDLAAAAIYLGTICFLRLFVLPRLLALSSRGDFFKG